MTKIISLQDLELFWTNVKTWIANHTDTSMSKTSTNPVQNKVVTQAIEDLTWKGTSAELEAALQAGTIKEGTKVFVTDDFTEPTITDTSTAAIEALFA